MTDGADLRTGRDRVDGRIHGAEEAVHVLVLNQHGDNRGDEAAFRAMFAGIEEHADVPVRFTVLHQFRGGSVAVETPQDVRWISLVPSLVEAVRMTAFGIGLLLGFRWRRALGPWGRSVVDAFVDAQVAVSAPGGPYFGDIYAGHEWIHWFYVWLAHRYDLPLVLYAPSVGPFERRLRNPLRRRLFSRFRSITVREEVSLEHLTRLLDGRGPPPVLASDSVMQRPLRPLTRAEHFGPDRTELTDRFLVGVSALEWIFPGHPDPGAAQAAYEEVLMECLLHLHRRNRAHFLFVPQLYGAAHSDVAYLESLGRRLPSGVSWELVSPDANSDAQQRIFGMTDLYVASRYHPQIFAVSQGVPGICIYYQHKALGFLRQFGLDRFAFPIGDLDGRRVVEALDEVLQTREELSAEIRRTLPSVREAAIRSSELVVEAFPR